MIEFGKFYAEVYDNIYADKNYCAECDNLESLFRSYSDIPVKKVLDLGCGTGNHAILLAERGYKVTGVDLSEGMINKAIYKQYNLTDIDQKKRLTFHLGDLKQLGLEKKFDAVLMMFAVLGYQHKNIDLLSALNSVHNHLKPGGIFIFDVWYGPAVINIRPSDRLKIIQDGERKLLRVASGSLDVINHISKVTYKLMMIDRNRVIKEWDEEHLMRFFFPQEIAFLLSASGMELTHLSSFDDIWKKPELDTWNIICVAKAKMD